MKKIDKSINQHNYLVSLLAVKIYKDYVDCLIFRPEPEHFFEQKMVQMGYGGDELMMFDVWRVFLFCLYVKARVQ